MLNKPEHRNPWLFVPTLAFALGMPLIIANQVATMMYASIGLSTETVGKMTILGLPIAFNVFFAPFVDKLGTKRQWIILTQTVLVISLAALCICLFSGFHVFPISVVLVATLALAAGVYAIPNGGFFVEALTKKEQGFFVGINTAFIRIAIIFTTGVLVIISGKFGEHTDNVYYGWSLFFGMCAAVMLFSVLWHAFILPYPPKVDTGQKTGYLEPFKEFFTMKYAALFVIYILIFRFGEALLSIMASPFFLNDVDQGGLGMTVAQVGFAKGTVGVAASIIGGVIAGFFLKGKHYRKMIIIFAICMTAPNALYIYLAHFQPQDTTTLNFSFLPALFGSDAVWATQINLKILAAITIETFGYGLGYTAFVFLVYRIANASRFRATTISIAMALQNVGWTTSGYISGYIQSAVGYEMLFTLSIVLSIPGIIFLIMLLRAREI
jgi:PAT family beta-lactamase induction signal transducer AmpG